MKLYPFDAIFLSNAPPLPSQKKQLSSKAYSVGIWGSVPLGFVKSMVLGGFWVQKELQDTPQKENKH